MRLESYLLDKESGAHWEAERLYFKPGPWILKI